MLETRPLFHNIFPFFPFFFFFVSLLVSPVEKTRYRRYRKLVETRSMQLQTDRFLYPRENVSRVKILYRENRAGPGNFFLRRGQRLCFANEKTIYRNPQSAVAREFRPHRHYCSSNDAGRGDFRFDYQAQELCTTWS